MCPCTLRTGATSQYLSASSMPFLTLFCTAQKQVFLHSTKLWPTLVSILHGTSAAQNFFTLQWLQEKDINQQAWISMCVSWLLKLPVPIFSKPFPYLFDVNTHAEYTLTPEKITTDKMAIHMIYNSTSKRQIVFTYYHIRQTLSFKNRYEQACEKYEVFSNNSYFICTKSVFCSRPLAFIMEIN